jgi:hypothetical protein
LVLSEEDGQWVWVNTESDITLTECGGDTFAFLVREHNPAEVLSCSSILASPENPDEPATDLVNGLGLAIQVRDILIQHLQRPSESTPGHAVWTVGVTRRNDIRTSFVNGAVDQEAGRVCRARHVSCSGFSKWN